MKFVPILLLFLLNTFSAISQIADFKIVSGFESKAETSSWINTQTLFFDSLGSNHFSRTDAAHPYGIGYQDRFPTIYQSQNVRLTVNAKVRMAQLQGKGTLVFSVTENEQNVFWEGKSVTSQVSDTGKWNSLSTSIDLPANFTDSSKSLMVFFWNENGLSPIDIDDVEFIFSEKKFPSFFPEVRTLHGSDSNSLLTVYAGKKYSFLFSNSNHSPVIVNPDGDTLFTDLNIVFDYFSKRGKPSVVHYAFPEFKSTVKSSSIADGIEIDFENREFSCAISIVENNETASLEFSSKIIFKKEVFIQRIALVLNQNLPLLEVYKRNTQIDSANFKKEYWLEREGFSIGEKGNKMVLYRAAKLSSVQLGNYGRSVAFNFDYAGDHPLMHFPEMKKNKGVFEDRSARAYRTGDSLLSEFHFDQLLVSDKIVRLAKNPDGYYASMVWTEHADYSDLRTQRAVNFGSENIRELSNATGGFAGRKIPVTKSVFYCNPEKQSVALKDSRFPGRSASVTGTPGFHEFLDQLKTGGFDICLHTPDPFTTVKDTLEQALNYMQSNFGSPSWIDHGYDNSPVSNREDLACDGTDRTSPVYAVDLWKKYGVKYLWNNFYEDSALLSRYSFNSFFSVPYSGWQDAFPTPEYWITPLRGDTIYSWRTGFTLDPPDGSMWTYYFSHNRLRDLIASNSDCILHCYPSRVDSSNGFYEFVGDSIVVNPEFDQALARLHEYHVDKKIWVTTVKALMDYRLALSKVELRHTANRSTIVYNNSVESIEGLTLLSPEELVFPQGFVFEEQKRAHEYVFIFTLQPQQKIQLSGK